MYSKGKMNLEMSPCSSDLVTNIYNCIPKGLMQIFQYFLHTLKYIKKISHTTTQTLESEFTEIIANGRIY